VPRAREASVDAAPRVVKVVRTAAVEGVSEKVAEDVEVERVERAVLGVDVSAQRGRAVQRRQLRERVADRQEDAVDLRVLVYLCVRVCARVWRGVVSASGQRLEDGEADTYR
jgi:hypothetical protein